MYMILNLYMCILVKVGFMSEGGGEEGGGGVDGG